MSNAKRIKTRRKKEIRTKETKTWLGALVRARTLTPIQMTIWNVLMTIMTKKALRMRRVKEPLMTTTTLRMNLIDN